MQMSVWVSLGDSGPWTGESGHGQSLGRCILGMLIPFRDRPCSFPGDVAYDHYSRASQLAEPCEGPCSMPAVAYHPKCWFP